MRVAGAAAAGVGDLVMIGLISGSPRVIVPIHPLAEWTRRGPKRIADVLKP